MLHIILFILKILGILLLGILGLAIVLLAIVLFVPVRYDFGADYHTSPDIRVKISWLFGGVKVIAGFNGHQIKLKASLLFKTLYETGGFKQEGDENEKAEMSEDVFESASNVFSDEEISEITTEISEAKPEPIGRTSERPAAKEEAPKKTAVNSEDSKKTVSKVRMDTKKTNKKSLFEKACGRISDISDKISGFFKNIEDKKEIFEKKWNQIQSFIDAECTKKSMSFIKQMLFSLLKHIAPKKIRGDIHFGFDKPSTTGRVLGCVWAIYPMYGDTLHMYPDFEKAILEGNLEIRGIVRFYIFGYWLLRAALCKDIHKVIKYIKHLKGEGGNK